MLNTLGHAYLAEQMICGNQNMEYMLATKKRARKGVMITCTMNVRNKNILSPGVNIDRFVIIASGADK